MADVVKTKNVLSIVAGFEDGDDRTINLDNPVANVSASAIKAAGTYAKDNGLLIGDKAGAACTGFKSAKVTESTTTYLDLND